MAVVEAAMLIGAMGYAIGKALTVRTINLILINQSPEEIKNIFFDNMDLTDFDEPFPKEKQIGPFGENGAFEAKCDLRYLAENCPFTLVFQCESYGTQRLRYRGWGLFDNKPEEKAYYVKGESNCDFDVEYTVSQKKGFGYRTVSFVINLNWTQTRKLIEENKNRARELLNEALRLMALGRFADAVLLLTQALNLTKIDRKLREELQKQLDIANAAAEAQVLINLANAMLKDGKFDEAFQKYETAGKISDHVVIQKNLEKAKKDAKAMQARHLQATKLLNLAKTEYKTGKYAEALVNLDKASKLAEVKSLVKDIKFTEWQTCSAYGMEQYARGRYLEKNENRNYEEVQKVHKLAIKLLEKAVKLNPEAGEEKKALAQVKIRFTANELFNKAVEKEEQASQQYKVGAFDKSMKLYDEAKKTYDKAAAKYKEGVAQDSQFQSAIDYTNKHGKSAAEVLDTLHKNELKDKVDETDYTDQREDMNDKEKKQIEKEQKEEEHKEIHIQID